MEGDTNLKCRVAVVGSGMAGLVTAYLLNQDPENRYKAEVFEIGEQLSLDSSSLSVPNPETGNTDRTDLPMRAFSDGFHNNLRAMYDFLGVKYRRQGFLFAFSSITSELSCSPRNLKSVCIFVATCPGEAILECPAHDLIDYKKKTNGEQHYTVYGGVNQVQRKLSQGLQIQKSAMVVSVEPQAQGTKICWESALDNPRSDMSEATFDRVILAVPPNVVQAIFKPLQYEMSHIPTITVQSVVHADETTIEGLSGTDNLHPLRPKTLVKGSNAQIIYLKTFAKDEPQTESIHLQPSGLLVTTCPVSMINPAKVTQCSTFTRVLRTPQSRQIIIDIFNRTSSGPQVHQKKRKTQWSNGDQGVWLLGGWCWDGMVLLEGSIVSSMIVAEAFGVKIPWKCCP